jgi:hypothetical protein
MKRGVHPAALFERNPEFKSRISHPNYSGHGGKPAHIASVMSAHFATGICRLKPAHIASAVPAHFATGIWGLKPAHIASEVPAHFATGIWGLKPAHIASEVSAHFAKGGSRRILQPANANPAHFANIPFS